MSTSSTPVIDADKARGLLVRVCRVNEVPLGHFDRSGRVSLVRSPSLQVAFARHIGNLFEGVGKLITVGY